MKEKKEDMIWNGTYFTKEGNDYCPVCWQSENNEIFLGPIQRKNQEVFRECNAKKRHKIVIKENVLPYPKIVKM